MLYSLAQTGKTKEKGFSLLEVLIAIVILTFGILAVGSMQVSSIQGNFHAGTITEAKSLAGDRLEKERAKAFTEDKPLVGGTDNSNPGYTIAWAPFSNNPVNNTTTITVTVTWGWGWGRRDLTISEVIPEGLV